MINEVKTNMNNFTEGREQWKGYNDGEISIAYTYSTPRGDKWFRCVAKTLEEARARRDDWLAGDQLETGKGGESKMTYFVINCSDSDGLVTTYEKEELLRAIDNEEYGSGIKFMESVNKRKILEWGDNRVLIIRGEIVTPQPKFVKYDI